MYWGENMNTSKIINFIETDGHRRGLSNLNIKNEKDIYSNITRIIKELFQWLESNQSDFSTEYSLNERVLRQTIKIYLELF